MSKPRVSRLKVKREGRAEARREARGARAEGRPRLLVLAISITYFIFVYCMYRVHVREKRTSSNCPARSDSHLSRTTRHSLQDAAGTPPGGDPIHRIGIPTDRYTLHGYTQWVARLLLYIDPGRTRNRILHVRGLSRHVCGWQGGGVSFMRCDVRCSSRCSSGTPPDRPSPTAVRPRSTCHVMPRIVP